MTTPGDQSGMSCGDRIRVSRDPMRAFGQGYTLGKVETYCEQVRTGTKLVASVLVNKKDIELTRHIIIREDCKALIDMTHSTDFASVFIFKYDFVKSLLEERNQRGTPKSALDNWVNGKLFGYSDYEIARWLHEHGYISSWP